MGLVGKKTTFSVPPVSLFVMKVGLLMEKLEQYATIEGSGQLHLEGVEVSTVD